MTRLCLARSAWGGGTSGRVRPGVPMGDRPCAPAPPCGVKPGTCAGGAPHLPVTDGVAGRSGAAPPAARWRRLSWKRLSRVGRGN